MSGGGVVPCPGGSACLEHHSCPECGGSGRVVGVGTVGTNAVRCPVCDGSGKVVYRKENP